MPKAVVDSLKRTLYELTENPDVGKDDLLKAILSLTNDFNNIADERPRQACLYFSDPSFLQAGRVITPRCLDRMICREWAKSPAVRKWRRCALYPPRTIIHLSNLVS